MPRLAICLLVCLLVAAREAAADLVLGSWNIRIFSTGSRTDLELEQIADRLVPFDLVALQEVRDDEVVARTLQILEDRGESFRALVSPSTGRSPQSQERYAILWRPDRVEPLSPGVLVPDPEDHFIRDPFTASFRADSFDFTLITVHILFGDRIADRRAEAGQLDEVYRYVQDADPDEQDVLLLGDFNLPPEDSGMEGLRVLLQPLFTGEDRTTISDRGLLDNIWLDPRGTTEFTGLAGIDRFDEEVFGNDDEAASLAVSDHRPLWARFRTDGPDDDGPQRGTGVQVVGWGDVKGKEALDSKNRHK